MKKLLIAAFAAVALAGKAHAGPTPTFEVAYSSFSQLGVICTTGTAVQLNASLPGDRKGMKIAGYRIQNQDSADAVYIGDVDVSTHAATAAALTNLGERIVAGADAVYMLDFDRDGKTRTKIYCQAADAAGAAAVVMSVFHFYH